MYTQCPKCEQLYSVTAANLRIAMGMVRCTHCAFVFNALSTLRDESEVSDAAAEPVGNQLPVQEMGDRVVIDPKFLSNQAWYKRAAELTRKHEQLAAATAPRRAEHAAQAEADTGGFDIDAEVAETVAAARAPFFLRLLGQTLTLAIRNLMRHQRRTALGMCAIGFGVIALALAGGFAEWMMWAERESTIHSRLGHIQIVKPGYFKSGVADPAAYLLADGDVDTEAIARLPHVQVVTPRVAFSGLISKGDTTVSFLGEGVQPATEKDVSKEVVIKSGRNLSGTADQEVILGKGLAASLGAQPGDTVVLLSNAPGGGVAAVEATVTGIFQTAVKAFDDVALRVPVALAQQATRSPGVHSWVILLDDTLLTDRVIGSVKEVLARGAVRLEIVPWYDLADFYKKVVELFSAQVDFVRLIIAVIIIMSISNTLVMSVLERTSEIGTLMAVGLRRNRIVRLFMSEGLLLGLLGGGVGTLLGYLLAGAISSIGIPMPPAPGMDTGFTAEIRTTARLLVDGFMLAVLATVLASLYPAWKASRLEIVDALRHSK